MPFLASALLATQPGDCNQQSETLRIARERPLTPHSNSPSVQLTIVPYFCLGWTVIDIDAEADPKTPRFTILRRQRRDRSGRVSIEWTDELRCSPVRSALTRLRSISLTIRPVEFDRLPLKPGGKPQAATPPRVVMDAPNYILRVQYSRQPDDSTSKLETLSNDGPVVAWAEDYLPRIERCWSPERT